MTLPLIIQGGMGIGLSNWKLANAVARLGQLGVISGTGLPAVFTRRLQQGDIGGHLRRALEKFPVPEIAKRVWEQHFVEGGKAPDAGFKPLRPYEAEPRTEIVETTIVATFAEVTLAKEGHSGKVGMNLLEKVQLGNLPALYGAMLAGVDYILMGAGIPREIPGVLDSLAKHDPVSIKLDVAGAAPTDDFRTSLNPREIFDRALAPLKRPQFLAIISSAVLALTLSKKATGKVNGFVVEGPTAGGHNAPPRGQMVLDDQGAPIYGSRDEVDLQAIKKLGIPFWLAGNYGSPERVREAVELGAAGVQVGTAFAFCRESALCDEYKEAVIASVREGDAEVFTDPFASPTGFPFKVVKLEGTLSEELVYEARKRSCDIGLLRRPYKRDDGKLGYRCPAENRAVYVAKGGEPDDCDGRKCICNGLVANIGLGGKEPPLLTAGDDLTNLMQFVPDGATSYGADDVVRHLLSEVGAAGNGQGAESIQ